MSVQARTRRGVPTGGQFITEPKQDSGIVDPGQEARYAAQGDFYLAAIADAMTHITAPVDDTTPEPVAPDVNWGKPYTNTIAYFTPDGPVWMRRRGQKVRFYNEDGDQVGDEQTNVAPAACYAHSQGWMNPHLYGL